MDRVVPGAAPEHWRSRKRKRDALVHQAKGSELYTLGGAARAGGWPAGLAAVKVELDVEGLPAPPLPGAAPGCAGVPAGVKAEQVVTVEIKTAVKVEINQPPRLATSRGAPVLPEGGAAAPATKRRWSGGAGPSGDAFCRRSRPGSRCPRWPCGATDTWPPRRSA
jgi:hypothetical protein